MSQPTLTVTLIYIIYYSLYALCIIAFMPLVTESRGNNIIAQPPIFRNQQPNQESRPNRIRNDRHNDILYNRTHQQIRFILTTVNMHSFTGRSIRHHFLFPALIWMSMVHGINGSSFTVNETHEFRRDLFDDATKDGIWAEYDCDSFIKDRPIYNESTWMMLRNVYHDTMGPLDSSIPLVAKTGFAVDHYIAHTDGKGRGVFTAQHIKKGQLVYAWVLHVAEFKTGPQYRRFLRSIPSDLVCETIMWSYIEDMKERAIVGYEDEHLSICLAIDDGSLFNDGGKDQANLGCQSEGAEYLPFGCDFNYFALRDISQGEELLVAYASFEVEDGWKAFGL